MTSLSDLILLNTSEINGHCRWFEISKFIIMQEANDQSELNKLHYELKMELRERGTKHVNIFKKKFQEIRLITKNKNDLKKIDNILFRLDDMISAY
jgi:hypothetical protein